MANIMKILPKQCQHLAKHNCLIKYVMIFYLWLKSLRHSATQNTNILTLSMKLIQRIIFFILLTKTHVNILTILYLKKIQPHFFFISIVEVLGQNLMILKTILVA